LRQALKKASRDKNITVSEFVRHAVEKELFPPMKEEIFFPFSGKHEEIVWTSLSEVLESVMYSFGRYADNHPEEFKILLHRFGRLWRERVGQGKKKTEKSGR